MSFVEPKFLLFYTPVLIVYWCLNSKNQNRFLFIASYFFYALIDVRFAMLLFIQSAVTYHSVILHERTERLRDVNFWFSLTFNIMILLYFKYFNFFIQNVNYFFYVIGFQCSLNTFKIVLPVGISFYTFQNISYIVDVRKKVAHPSKSLVNYCLFINFFPKLLAGPIERASNFLSQIEQERVLTNENLSSGIVLFLWGYFQKSVIADNIATISNKIFLLEDTSGYILFAGAFAFTMQIFADFSGYTDMARGLGKMLGFDLVKNFDNPYFAQNPADFWRRWHMSFSQWIRDYIYIPMGGSRVSTSRLFFNLFIAFFFTGLWHGSSWNFIIWGIYYWLLYFCFWAWKSICPSYIYSMKYNFVISTCIMFCLTNVGWVIFRETDISYLQKYLTSTIFTWKVDHLAIAVYLMFYILVISSPLIIYSAFTFIFEERRYSTLLKFSVIKCALCIIFIVSIILLKPAGDEQFIYFNF